MIDKGRKFPANLENPIDNQIIYVGKYFYNVFRRLQLIPNHLTFASLITGLLSIYLFYEKCFVLSSLIYFISYSLDVLDGNYARKYDMVTRFGDYFDHIKDLFVNVLLLSVFFKFTTIKYYIICTAISLILVVLMSLHLGCQEVYVEKINPANSSHYLSFLGAICKKCNLIDKANILKYVGCGTFALWVSMLIASHAYS